MKEIKSASGYGEYLIEEDFNTVTVNGEQTVVSCFAVYFREDDGELKFRNAFPTEAAAERYIANTDNG